MHICVYIIYVYTENVVRIGKNLSETVFLKITSFWPEFAISDQILCIDILIFMYIYIIYIYIILYILYYIYILYIYIIYICKGWRSQPFQLLSPVLVLGPSQ